MNADTRDRLRGALAQLAGGVGALEALAADGDADLLRSERTALTSSIPPLLAAIEPVGALLAQGSERAPSRGKVIPPTAPAPTAAPAPAADGAALLASALKQVALAVRDGAMALRDLADAHREVAAPAPPPPAPAAPVVAVADPASTAPKPPRRAARSASDGVGTAEVARALGVTTATMHSRIRREGGPKVGLTVEGWQVVSATRGDGGRHRLQWERTGETEAA